VLRFCDPYELDVPSDLVDGTGYVFEEAGGGDADRLTIEVEDLPAAVSPADMIAAARASAARALGGGVGWSEGQVDTGLGPAHTLAITDPEIVGGVWVAALRGPAGRMWTLRFESARRPVHPGISSHLGQRQVVAADHRVVAADPSTPAISLLCRSPSSRTVTAIPHGGPTGSRRGPTEIDREPASRRTPPSAATSPGRHR